MSFPYLLGLFVLSAAMPGIIASTQSRCRPPSREMLWAKSIGNRTRTLATAAVAGIAKAASVGGTSNPPLRWPCSESDIAEFTKATESELSF